MNNNIVIVVIIVVVESNKSKGVKGIKKWWKSQQIIQIEH